MRFNLADVAGWLDGATLRLKMTIVNLSANALIPFANSPASLLRRMRIIGLGSAMLEDIEHFGRTHEMFSMFLSPEELRNRITEEWGSSTANATLGTPGAPQEIPAGQARTVMCQLSSSFLSQGKYLPLSFLPIVIELELDDATAAMDGVAIDWQIERPELVGDVCHLDVSLANSFAKFMLEGKSLPIAYQGVYSVQASIPGGSSLYSLPIARGFTRLNKVLISFKTAAGKESTNFEAPLNNQANTAANDVFSWYLMLGSERFPSFDVTSLQESFYRLRQTMPGQLALDTAKYGDDHFVTGLSLEKVPNGGAHTGANTRSGSQLSVVVRNPGADIVYMYVTLLFDAVCNLSSSGPEVLD
jgi:hypothetical protein